MRMSSAIAAFVLIALASNSASAVAEIAAPTIKRGSTLRDAKNVRLSLIDRVNIDGSVTIIFNSKFVTIPADKLAVIDSVVTTSLTKSEVAKLR